MINTDYVIFTWSCLRKKIMGEMYQNVWRCPLVKRNPTLRAFFKLSNRLIYGGSSFNFKCLECKKILLLIQMIIKMDTFTVLFKTLGIWKRKTKLWYHAKPGVTFYNQMTQSGIKISLHYRFTLDLLHIDCTPIIDVQGNRITLAVFDFQIPNFCINHIDFTHQKLTFCHVWWNCWKW